ncbi:MAG: terminase TerL endonuclease subunit, partial [Hominilimicola sp.]
LPDSYAIDAMSSGQLTVLNKLGCIISTKYPKSANPFEDQVSYAKRVLDDIIPDETLFALLYEPDNTENWETDDSILEQSNPLALELPKIMEDLKHKRKRAIEMESARENFLTKHCNIIYQGAGTESYIDIKYVRQCAVKEIDWSGMTVYVGVDLSISNDNTSVVMIGQRDGIIYSKPMVFIPEGRTEEKSRLEKVDYTRFIRAGQCIPCGNLIIDYSVVEEYVLNIERRFKVKVASIGFDRANAISSAQKWEKAGLNTDQILQHSYVLHPATKLLFETVMDGRFAYEENMLYEINFENAQCTFDTNFNRYVNKKRSNGKVDMVVATINAVHELMQYEIIDQSMDWGIQVL